MPSIGTCAGSTNKRQEVFLQFPRSTFPGTICLALGCNKKFSLLLSVHAPESFITISFGLGLVSLTSGDVFSPNILKLLILADLVHPGSTLPSRERFWETETWVIWPLRLSAYTPPRELHAVIMQQNPNLDSGILSKKYTQVQSSLSRCQKIQSNNTTRRFW